MPLPCTAHMRYTYPGIEYIIVVYSHVSYMYPGMYCMRT